jgi:hypothetical protein
MGPYHWLIGSLMDPEDDFCQRLRKSVVGVFFFPGSFLALYYVVKLLVEPGPVSGTTRWILFAANLTLASMYWVQYFMLRSTRTVGPLQAAAVPWATTLFLQPAVWINVDADLKVLWIFLCLLAVLMQVPKVYLYLGVVFVVSTLGDWNIVHLEDPRRCSRYRGLTVLRRSIDSSGWSSCPR